jgi:hypothetical protein
MDDDKNYTDMYESGRSVTFYIGDEMRKYPVTYFESFIAGEDVDPIPVDALRVIVKEWLKQLKHQWYGR